MKPAWQAAIQLLVLPTSTSSLPSAPCCTKWLTHSHAHTHTTFGRQGKDVSSALHWILQLLFRRSSCSFFLSRLSLCFICVYLSGCRLFVLFPLVALHLVPSLLLLILIHLLTILLLLFLTAHPALLIGREVLGPCALCLVPEQRLQTSSWVALSVIVLEHLNMCCQCETCTAECVHVR